jgi:hypothetical protein
MICAGDMGSKTRIGATRRFSIVRETCGGSRSLRIAGVDGERGGAGTGESSTILVDDE